MSHSLDMYLRTGVVEGEDPARAIGAPFVDIAPDGTLAWYRIAGMRDIQDGLWQVCYDLKYLRPLTDVERQDYPDL